MRQHDYVAAWQLEYRGSWSLAIKLKNAFMIVSVLYGCCRVVHIVVCSFSGVACPCGVCIIVSSSCNTKWLGCIWCDSMLASQASIICTSMALVRFGRAECVLRRGCRMHSSSNCISKCKTIMSKAMSVCYALFHL